MNGSRPSLWIIIALIGLATASAPALAQNDCENLAKQKLEDVTIISAVFMKDPQGFTLPQTPGMFGTPAGLKTKAPNRSLSITDSSNILPWKILIGTIALSMSTRTPVKSMNASDLS
jgi:hypothetical protein